MREKRSAIKNVSIELWQRRFYLAWDCGSLLRHSGERHKPFSRAKIYLFLVFGAINCLIFAAPTVVKPSEKKMSDTSLSTKAAGKDVLWITNQAGSTGTVSGKTNPKKVARKKSDPDPAKSTKAPKKGSSNPFLATTLLAQHPPPLLEPTSDLATPLSGPRSPQTVRLFKRLYYHGKRMDRYRGRQFIAEGEAYRSKDLPRGYFMLFRWQIDCCTGEVEPLGILVRSSAADGPNKAHWVNVDGFLEIQMIDGFRLPYLSAVKVKKMPPPLPEKQFISF